MSVIVPLQAVADQTFNILLNDQSCTINLYQKSTGMFIDLFVNDVMIIGGVICENLTVIVRSLYLGFVGDLAFWDIQGSADPYYTGLNSRYFLYYLFPSDLPSGLN